MALLSNLIHCDSEAFISTCYHSSGLDWFASGQFFFSQCPYQLRPLQHSNKLRLLITDTCVPFSSAVWSFCKVLQDTAPYYVCLSEGKKNKNSLVVLSSHKSILRWRKLLCLDKDTCLCFFSPATLLHIIAQKPDQSFLNFNHTVVVIHRYYRKQGIKNC